MEKDARCVWIVFLLVEAVLRFLNIVVMGVVLAVAVSGCARRALLVAPVSVEDMNVTGLPFCLAKGIVTLTVSNLPKDGATLSATTSLLQPPSQLGGPVVAGLRAVKQQGDVHLAQASGATEPPEGGGPGDAGPVVTPPAVSPTPAQIPSTFGNTNLTLSIGKVSYLPDCDFQYTVSLNHDVFNNDDVSVEIDPTTKLLKAVNSVLTDETPNIFKRIAEAPAEIVGAANIAGYRALKRADPGYFAITHDVDPTDPKSVAIFNRHLGGLLPSVRLYTRPLIALPNMPRTKATCEEDLCFRTAMPYVVELATTEHGATKRRVVAQQMVVVPNPYLVASIPVTRAPFVKKEVALEFKDGMLVKTHIKNPSEVLGFLEIPINVAKTLVAIPSAMFKYEVIQTQNNAALLTEQKNVLTLQKEIIEAQRALLAAAAQK